MPAEKGRRPVKGPERPPAAVAPVKPAPATPAPAVTEPAKPEPAKPQVQPELVKRRADQAAGSGPAGPACYASG